MDICATVCTVGPSIGFAKAEISAWSFCAGGTMDIIMERVYPNTIHLVAR